MSNPPGRHADGNDADGAIDLEDGHFHVAELRDAVLAKGCFQRRFVQPFLTKVCRKRLTVQHEKCRSAFERAPDPRPAEPGANDDCAQGEQHARRNDAARHRCVGTDHGVLHGVCQQEENDEIEHGNLTDLSLSAQSKAYQNHRVDHGGSHDDVRCRAERDHAGSFLAMSLVTIFGIL